MFPVTPIQYQRAIVDLVVELFPREEHDRWFLTPQPALSGDWPALATLKGNHDAVYRLLLRLKRGN